MMVLSLLYSFFASLSSLLRVYPMERPGTSVELRILPTHLHRGESGSREVGDTEELGRITQRGQREKSDTSMEVRAREHPLQAHLSPNVRKNLFDSVSLLVIPELQSDGKVSRNSS
jgi:hypothetical protein